MPLFQSTEHPAAFLSISAALLLLQLLRTRPTRSAEMSCGKKSKHKNYIGRKEQWWGRRGEKKKNGISWLNEKTS